MSEARRVVTDSMLGLTMPEVDVWSPRVVVVLGLNPGPFTGPGTNTYLIGTGSSRILLDAGQGVPRHLDLLQQALAGPCRGAHLQEIVLTHGHPDHMGGVAGVLARFGPVPVKKKPHPRLDGAVPIVAIDEGSVIATEGATLRAVATPGHASDHLCFVLEEEGAVFTGDVVLGAGTTVIPDDGDLLDYLASLRRLLGLSPQVLYPAHGPAIRDPERKIREYLAHRELREQQVLECLSCGAGTEKEIVERIYTDVPRFLHEAAAMSVRAHLRKLQREGRVEFLGGTRWHLTGQ